MILLSVVAAALAANPLSVAVIPSIPLAGSDHTMSTDLADFARFAPGIGMRLEVGWGRPELRAGITLVATDQFFDRGACCDPEYYDGGVAFQVDHRLVQGDWALRLPVEVGLGAGIGTALVPELRLGAGLRLTTAKGYVRPVFEARLLTTFGFPVQSYCLGSCYDVANPNGWQAALNIGAEFGKAYDSQGSL